MSYLDRLPEFNNKAILVQSTLGYQMAMAYLGYRDVGLENLESGSYLLGDFEDNNGPFNNVQLASPNESLFDSLSDEITWYNQLLGVANDTNQSEDTRLKCLTELVDQARLNEVPLLPYNPVITPQTNIPPSALVIHNETTGVEGVGFLHIGPVELALIYSARQSFDSFAQITGVYTDNASLVGGFATKEDLITPSGDADEFWNGNKTFSAISFNQLASTPTTLAGYGISASDTLFDNKYLQLGSQLQTLNTTSGTPLTTTTTVIEGFGRLQNQVSARELSLGNPAVNGYVLSSTTAGVRSWIPVPSGTAVTGISLTGTNGITGGVVITAGNAVITAGTNRTGMLKGNGTAISAATEMTDYIGITGATNGDTILFTGGVATWAPGLSNPMTLLGDLIIGGASGATTRLAGNTTTTRKFLMSVGASGAALAQTYETLLAGDIPNIAISQVTNLQTNLDQKLSDNLLSGQIFIGNLSDLATGVVPSGDWTIDTTGVATIEPNAVTFDKFIQATGPQILVGTPDILGVQDFRQITLDPATLQIDAFGVMSSIATGTGTVTNTNTLTLNSLVLGDGGTAVKVGGGFTTDGVSQLTLGVSGTSVGGLLLTNVTSGTIELRPVTGALGTTVLTLFAGSDTLVGLAATQTLTNKTLTNPQINGALLQTSSTVGYVWTATNTTGAGSWQAPTGGGGSGTVTSIATAGLISGGTITTTGTITTSMATNKLVGRGTAGTGIMEEITLGTGLSLTGTTLNATGGGSGTVTSVDLTMPTAFSVTGNPITTSGTLAVTGAGTVSQYIRGDGTLANFPTSGGGGSSLSYYLNGSVTQFGTYKQMNRMPVIGAGTNFTLNNTTGYALMAQFVTDANDPSLLNIPAGSWDIGFYFSSSNNTGNPAFYVELLKYDGTTFTTIANNSANPEIISNGTAVDLYNTSIAVSSTSLTITDRLVIRVYVDTAGSRTITFHTEDNNLAQIITTFTTGLTAFNGLTAQVQFLGAVGTAGNAPAWTSTTATHTLDIPLANAGTGVTAGLISNTEFNIFNDKMSNPMTAEGDIIYGGTVTGGVAAPTVLPIGSNGKVLTVVSGVPAWGTVGAGDVVGPAGATDGDFAVFSGTSGKIIAEPANASLTLAGRATFNSGVEVGLNGTTTGQLVFRNSGVNGFTTTIQASASASANANYTWPQAPGTVGQILATDGSGNLSWTAAGAGDMTLVGVQTVTGAKTFGAAGNVGKLIIAGSTSGTTVLNSGAVAGSSVLTLPVATSTLACLSLAQTFSALQTLSAGLTVSGGVTTFSHPPTTSTPISVSGAGSTANPHVSFTGTTINWMSFGTTGIAAPTLINSPSRSVGTKVVILQGSGSALDSAIGVESIGMWLSSSQAIRFYTNASTTVRAAFDGDVSNSNLTLTNPTAVSIVAASAATANLFNTIATTVNIAGATTTLNMGNNTLAQTINIGTASTQVSTYNFATGATVSGVTKTINIGTAGVSGSTTAVNIGSAVAGATNTITIRGNLTLGTSGGNMGFWGTAAVARQTITSDTLANLYTALRAYGLIL